MNSEIRVRFAPSPTGHLHIGGLRAAFFNWLFARHNNGKYLLRIEDTDLERSKKEFTDSILASFAWTQVEPDEPVVIQSQRIAEHQKVANQLIADGKAYKCYCTPDELAARLQAEYGNVLFTKYDGFCRKRTDEPNKPFAIRFAIPESIASISFNDLIRGTVTFDRDQLDDFIIVRSDGTPMYNFVVVVDDAFMRISHVIRGEDHVPNTPKQILLYQACNYPLPQFAHLPMILGPSGDRLSKRDGAVSVLEYKSMGYLPDALLNYLVRLGWAHGDQEIFTRQELIQFFTLEGVNKKGAIFDPTKLDWVNSIYIRNRSAHDLVHYVTQEIDPQFLQSLRPWNEDQIITLVTLYKERVKTLREMVQELKLLHNGPQEFSAADIEHWINPDVLNYMPQLLQTLEGLQDSSTDTISIAIKDLCKNLGIKLVALAQPLRIALVGKTASPGIFELISIVGKDKTIARLRTLIQYCKKS